MSLTSVSHFITIFVLHLAQLWIFYIEEVTPNATLLVHSSFKADLEKYLLEKSQGLKHVPLPFLESFLSQFQQVQCLTIVNNLYQINLGPTTSPILIRTLVPLILKNLNLYQLIFGPTKFAPTNISTDLWNTFVCPTSKLFSSIGIYRIPDFSLKLLCVWLNKTLFWMQTRPLNFQIQISLLPTILHYKVYGYSFKGLSSRFPFEFPNLPRPTSIHAFVHETTSVTLKYFFHDYYSMLDLFLRRPYISRRTTEMLCSKIFLLVSLDEKIGDKISSRYEPQQLVRLCPFWRNSENFRVPLNSKLFRILKNYPT